MADQTITITIPSDKVTLALEGFLKLYPNNEMTEEEEPKSKYTIKQWITEQLRRLLVRDIRRGLQMIANENANVPVDETLAESI